MSLCDCRWSHDVADSCEQKVKLPNLDQFDRPLPEEERLQLRLVLHTAGNRAGREQERHDQIDQHEEERNPQEVEESARTHDEGGCLHTDDEELLTPRLRGSQVVEELIQCRDLIEIESDKSLEDAKITDDIIGKEQVEAREVDHVLKHSKLLEEALNACTCEEVKYEASKEDKTRCLCNLVADCIHRNTLIFFKFNQAGNLCRYQRHFLEARVKVLELHLHHDLFDRFVLHYCSVIFT